MFLAWLFYFIRKIYQIFGAAASISSETPLAYFLKLLMNSAPRACDKRINALDKAVIPPLAKGGGVCGGVERGGVGE
jgi:hypothetical protein